MSLYTCTYIELLLERGSLLTLGLTIQGLSFTPCQIYKGKYRICIPLRQSDFETMMELVRNFAYRYTSRFTLRLSQK